MNRTFNLTEDDISEAIRDYIHARHGEPGKWQTTITLPRGVTAKVTVEPLQEENVEHEVRTSFLVTDSDGHKGIVR